MSPHRPILFFFFHFVWFGLDEGEAGGEQVSRCTRVSVLFVSASRSPDRESPSEGKKRENTGKKKQESKNSPPAHGQDLLDVPVVRVQLLVLPGGRRYHGQAAVGEPVPHERGPPERGDRERQPQERDPEGDVDGGVPRVRAGLEEELLALVVRVRAAGAEGEAEVEAFDDDDDDEAPPPPSLRLSP